VEALKFKGDRINPIAGIRRLFALRGLVELLKALAKFLVVGLVAILVLQWESDRFISLGRQSVEMALTHSAWLIAVAFVLINFVVDLVYSVLDPRIRVAGRG